MKTLLFCALILCFVIPCSSTPTVPSPFAKGALNVMQDYAETLKNGKPAQIAAWYAPDGQLLLPGTVPLTGPKAIEDFLTPLVKQAKVTDVSVKIDIGQGTTRYATLLGTYVETFVIADGKPQIVTGRFAGIWKSDADFHWHILRLMMQPAPPDNVGSGAKS